MTARCLVPPTPAFRVGQQYSCEPIPGGMVVYDHEGFAWASDIVEFYRCFKVLYK